MLIVFCLLQACIVAAAPEVSVLLAPPDGGVGEKGKAWQSQVEQAAAARLEHLPGILLIRGENVHRLLLRPELAFRPKRALIAAHLEGARYVVVCRIILRPGAPDVHLRLLEGITGLTVLEQTANLRDPKSLPEALDKLTVALSSLPAPSPRVMIGVAPLSLRPEVDGSDPDPAADLLTAELQRRLEGVPNHVWIDGDLAAFLVEEATHAKDNAAAQSHGSHKNMLLVTGELSAQRSSASAYAIHLKAIYGGKESSVDVTGVRSSFVDLDEQAGDKLLTAVQAAGIDSGPAPLAAQREKIRTARKLIQQEASTIPDAWRTKSTEVDLAVECVQKARELLPGSIQPFLAIRRELLNPRLTAEPHGAPLLAIRADFINQFPDASQWADLVSQQIRGLRAAGRTEAELEYAQKLAEAMLDGRCGAPEQSRDQPAIQTLVQQAQHQLAFHYALAALTSEPQMATPALEILATSEFNAGNTVYALNAIKNLAEYCPGRELAWLGKENHAQKVAGSDLGEWFKPILATRGQTASSLPEPPEFRNSPPMPAGLLPAAAALPGMEPIALPQNSRLLAMATGKQVYGLLLVNGTTLSLWSPKTGECNPIEGIKPDSNGNYNYLRLFTAGENVFLLWRDHGWWQLDTKTLTATTPSLGSLIDPRLSGAWETDGKLYLAGSHRPKSANPDADVNSPRGGFIAKRAQGQTEYTVYDAPEGAGAICAVAPATDGEVTLLHEGQQHFTRFNTRTGQWISSGYGDNWRTDNVAHLACRPNHLLVMPVDVLNSRELYSIDRRDWTRSQLFYTPGPVGCKEYVHEWFWSDGAKGRAVPLTGPPVDLTDDGSWLWILDCNGALTGSQDGENFAGPFKLGSSGLGLVVHEKSLYVGSDNSLRVIDLTELHALAGAKGATRSVQQVFTDTQAALESWTRTLPPLSRAAYFQTVRRSDLAADDYLKSDLVKTRAGALAVAQVLLDAARDKEALALLRPLAADPQALNVKDLEVRWLKALQGERRWDELFTLIPKLWNQSPLRGELIPADERFWAYNSAQLARQTDQDYEKSLWDMLGGQFPDAPWSWTDDPAYRRMGLKLQECATRALLVRLAEQRQFQKILSHPQLGPKQWDKRGWGSQWLLFIGAGEKDLALASAKDASERASVLIELGRFAEALALMDDPKLRHDSYTLRSLVRAPLYEGKWDVYDRCRRSADDFAGSDNFDEREGLIELLRRDLPATQAWATAEKHEFLGQTDQAMVAYGQCAAQHAESLAGAESLLRLAELAWLGKKDPAGSQAAFTKAQAAMARLAESADKPTAAWALFRMGMIARVYRNDIPAAREFWKTGQALKGSGALLCRYAMDALRDAPPILAAGNQREPEPLRVVSIDLTQGNWVSAFADGRRHKAVGFLYAPVFGCARTHDWGGPLNAWFYYLWYPQSHYRPGIGWVRITLDGRSDLVWCTLR